MFPLRLRNCRVIRADDQPEPTRYDKDSNEYVPTIDPAARAEGLAARAARSFVAPMKLAPSAVPFAVGDRVNVRLLERESWDGETGKWYSAVVERKRGNKYDVLLDDGDRESGIPAAFVRREGPADGLIIMGGGRLSRRRYGPDRRGPGL